MKVQIDYEALAGNAANAMRKVTQLFERAGLPVVDVASSGKTSRIAGISFREASFTFADSQKLTLRVKATGDVYEARINGKVVPVSNQEDPAKAVAELVHMLEAGRAKFQKRLAALKMVPPPGAKTAAPKLHEALVAQIAQVNSEIDAATEELAALKAA